MSAVNRLLRAATIAARAATGMYAVIVWKMVLGVLILVSNKTGRGCGGSREYEDEEITGPDGYFRCDKNHKLTLCNGMGYYLAFQCSLCRDVVPWMAWGRNGISVHHVNMTCA